MSALPRPLTYDDLLEMPDNGIRREVLQGELIVNPAPTADHQDVVGNLYLILRAYMQEFGGHVYLAPFDVILGRYDVVQPDLIFLSAARPRIAGDKHGVEGAPDLVVEVVSPGTGWSDRTRKMALYATSGVPEFWVIDPPRRTIAIHVLDGDQYHDVSADAEGRVASQALPGLILDPQEVFADLA